ncbi:MAG TPA: hypothetical protein V6D27_15915 [Vampirovibrionales bacterium]
MGSKSQRGPGWKPDRVRLSGPQGWTGKTSQGDRPHSSKPGKVPGIAVSPETRGRITTPSSAIIPDLIGDVQVCSV